MEPKVKEKFVTSSKVKKIRNPFCKKNPGGCVESTYVFELLFLLSWFRVQTVLSNVLLELQIEALAMYLPFIYLLYMCHVPGKNCQRF